MAEESLPQQLREIDGCPGYFAGRDGRIYSTRRLGRPKPSTPARPIRPLKAGVNKRNGYLQVALGSASCRNVHALVCAAFHGPRPPGFHASHIDGDKLNCRPENLCWESRTANERRKATHGTLRLGDRHPQAKLTEAIVAEARRLVASGASNPHALARRFGVAHKTMIEAVAGKTWGHVA